LDVTGQNMANVNTIGYSRRVVTFGAVAPADENVSAGEGVEVLNLVAVRDSIYDRRLFNELPYAGRETAIGQVLSAVEASLGESGESIDASLTRFFDAWATLADDPTSAVARAQVLGQGQALSTDFNNMAARFADSVEDTDRQVRSTVERINSLTTQIAALNGQITSVDTAGKATLKDTQSELVKQLAALTQTQVVEQNDGTVQITLAQGQPLVIGNAQYTLGVTNEPLTGHARITAAGADITAQVTAGNLGGLINARDVLIPGYQSQLDALAYGVVTQVNTLTDAGFTLTGVDAPPFFSPIGAPAGAATAMRVNPAVMADSNLVAAGGVPGAPGNNQVANALAAMRDGLTMNGGRATFGDAWAQIVSTVGQTIQTSGTELASRQEVVNQIENLRDSVSGVNLDDETANMVKFQTAYEANARYFQTVNSLLDTLMSLAS
jgi:flagellar hook-associated protein 1 FlgK